MYLHDSNIGPLDLHRESVSKFPGSSNILRYVPFSNLISMLALVSQSSKTGKDNNESQHPRMHRYGDCELPQYRFVGCRTLSAENIERECRPQGPSDLTIMVAHSEELSHTRPFASVVRPIVKPHSCCQLSVTYRSHILSPKTGDAPGVGRAR